MIASFVTGGCHHLTDGDFATVRRGVNPEINALASLILFVVGIVGFIARRVMAHEEKQRLSDIQKAKRG